MAGRAAWRMFHPNSKSALDSESGCMRCEARRRMGLPLDVNQVRGEGVKTKYAAPRRAGADSRGARDDVNRNEG